MRTFLSAVLLAALAPHAAGQAARGRSLDEQVTALLADVRRPADAGRAASQLARLGEGVVEPLFARLGRGEDEVARRAAILGALAQVTPEHVRGFLAVVARGTPSEAERRAGLDLLGRFGSTEDLTLALVLGGPSEPDAPPGPALRTALEEALAGILSREPGASRTLAEAFPSVSPAARASIATVLGRRGAPAALADLLGRADADADLVVLLELARTSSGPLAELDAHVAERVRVYLAHPEEGLAILAVGAAVALGDDAVVPELIVLLEDPRKNVQGAARAALQSLTEERPGEAAGAWLAWLDEGLAWWNERAEACRADLVSGAAGEAAAALREVARQRLFVREVVPLLQLAARRSESDIASSACRALAALPPRFARAALLDLARLPELPSAEMARAELARLPGEGPGPSRIRSSLPHLRPMP